MDNGPKKNGSLPDPELNPMLNPTLGKNLGRWAQVYFTSPPEKREEAVQELLKELENGGNGDIAVQVSSPPAPSETKDDFAERDDMLLAGFNAVAPTRAEPEEQREFTPPKPAFEPPEVSYRQSKELFPDEVDNGDVAFEAEERPDGEVCPACLHKNEPRQRFCGFCGFTLHSEINPSAPISAAPRQPNTQVASSPRTPVASSPRTPVAPSPRTPVAPPARSQQAPVRPASLHTDERDAETWQWLHEKNLAKLATAHEREGRWKVPLITILLLAMGGGYLYWRSTTGDAGVSTAATQEQTQNTQMQERNKPGAPSNVPGVVQRNGSRPQAEPARQQRTVPPPANRSQTISGRSSETARVEAPRVTPKAPSPPSEIDDREGASASPFQEGLQELAMGRRYLSGDGVPRDHATAAKWLWKSVGKQNPDAVILLSDLYVRGDGVPQSCDQARILLTAAAKRSSPGAADKLRSVLAVCR